MAVFHRCALSVAVVLGAFAVVGCEEANDAKERNATIVVPPDMPKTSDEAIKQQMSMAPDPKKKTNSSRINTPPPPPMR